LSGSPSRACPHPNPARQARSGRVARAAFVLPLGERVLGLFCRVIVGEFQPVGLTGCVLASHRDAPSLYTGRSCTPGRSSCLFLERALFLPKEQRMISEMRAPARLSYGRIPHLVELKDLIATQVESFSWVKNEGLR